MPKNPPQDKKTISEKRVRSGPRRSLVVMHASPQPLARIMKEQAWLQGVDRVRAGQQQWLIWLNQALPEELRGSIVHVVHKGEELTVHAASAPWSARLRFALDALIPKIKERAPDIVKVRVRVAPAGRSG